MGCPPLGVTTKLVSLGICFQSFQTAFIEALELIEWVGKKQNKKTKKKRQGCVSGTASSPCGGLSWWIKLIFGGTENLLTTFRAFSSFKLFCSKLVLLKSTEPVKNTCLFDICKGDKIKCIPMGFCLIFDHEYLFFFSTWSELLGTLPP